MALGQGNLAGLARVAFQVDTGEFNRDISVAEARYRQATQGMSDDAIRLELAQERLRRALAKGPTAYREIANAELNLRRVQQGLRGDTDDLSRSFDRHGRSLDRFGRGALLGSGAFRGLARSITFASSAFLGGAGLVYGMRQALSIASNLEEQQNKVSVTFRDSGSEVIEWSRSTSTAMGIAQDQALAYVGTIGGILNSSGLARSESARLSQQIVQLAADMASFNNASPEETLQAIRSGLVGEIEPLRRYQVLLTEAVVAQEAMRETGKASKDELTQGEKVLARYRLILKQTTDQQGDYARTAEGTANSERTLQALWRETQGIVGQALLPAYTDVIHSLRDWLAEDENRVRLQRDVNEAVKTGETVARGLAAGLGTVRTVLEPVVRLMGGLENTIQAALVIGLVLKVRKAALSFGLIAASSKATTASVVRDAAIAGRALDVAYRPRTVTVTGGGAPVGGGRRGIPPVLGFNPVTAVLIAAGVVGFAGIRSGRAPAIDSGEMEKLKRAAQQGRIGWAELDRLRPVLTDAQERELSGVIARRNARTRGPARPDDRAGPRGPGAVAAERPTTTGGGEGGGGRPRRTVADIELELARAEARRDESARARLLREEQGLFERQIAFLERRKNLTDKQKEQLRKLYGDIARVQSELDSIAEESERKVSEQREAARERQEKIRERAQERQERRHQRVLDAIEAEEERRENRRRAAALTERLSDDKRRLQADIAYERARSRDERLTAAERREHIRKRLELQKELRDLNKKEAEERKKTREEREKKGLTTSEIEALQEFGLGVGLKPGDTFRGRAKEQAKTKADEERRRIAESQVEFLNSLQGIMNQFGGNLFSTLESAPASDPRVYSELRHQSELLGGLASAARGPGTRFAGREIDVAFEGPTF